MDKFGAKNYPVVVLAVARATSPPAFIVCHIIDEKCAAKRLL
jgi:hypothetical protein